jgi:hypothetical protein
MSVQQFRNITNNTPRYTKKTYFKYFKTQVCSFNTVHVVYSISILACMIKRFHSDSILLYSNKIKALILSYCKRIKEK